MTSSIRTSTRRVDRLQPGDRVMLIGIQVAVVKKIEFMVERGVIRTIPGGWARDPEDVFWTEIHLVWEKYPDAPESVVILPGDRFIALRDTGV